MGYRFEENSQQRKTQMAQKHLKKCTTFLVISELQILTERKMTTYLLGLVRYLEKDQSHGNNNTYVSFITDKFPKKKSIVVWNFTNKQINNSKSNHIAIV